MTWVRAASSSSALRESPTGMDKYLSQLQKESRKETSAPAQAAAAPATSDRNVNSASEDAATTAGGPKTLPKGVVLGKDGKPCRSCSSVASWMALAKQQPAPSTPTKTSSTAVALAAPPSDCPPDVDALGRHTWTLLHSVAAAYPDSPTAQQKQDVSTFLRLFGRLYPCWVCAEDFQTSMQREPPNVSGRLGLGQWMCRAHNEVNRKLGKEEFDCRRWAERWKDGWKDGSCG